MKIDEKDMYTTFFQLVLHSESISWSRFNNLLIINSILILAWATIFASNSSSRLASKIVMVVICALGILSSVAWADLGKRGREYLDAYKNKAKSIETNKKDWWEGCIDNDYKPFHIDKKPKWYSSSRFLVGYGPYFFVVVYGILLIASFS